MSEADKDSVHKEGESDARHLPSPHTTENSTRRQERLEGRCVWLRKVSASRRLHRSNRDGAQAHASQARSTPHPSLILLLVGTQPIGQPTEYMNPEKFKEIFNLI